MPADKQYTRQVTERFLKEMDRIVGYGENGKTNQYNFAVKVGIDPASLSRMKKHVKFNVTLEACGKLIEHYGTDPMWLYMGEDYEVKVDERIQQLNKMLEHMGKLLKLAEPAAKSRRAKVK